MEGDGSTVVRSRVVRQKTFMAPARTTVNAERLNGGAMRRVVVTGMGGVCGLGASWS